MKKSFYYASLVLTMALTVFTACGGSDDDDEKGNGDQDPRISQVIPTKYRSMLEKYIPIYDGVNPPNVEGVYLKSPNTVYYDYTNQWEAGHKVNDMYYQFSNQNMSRNTLDYKDTNQSGSSVGVGNGAFISGDGNNFTIFFLVTQTSKSKEDASITVTMKQATIVSGTKTSEGIKNFYTGFIVTEKGSDPYEEFVDEGDFRVFRDGDGLASNASWPTNAPEYVFTRAKVEQLLDECDK